MAININAKTTGVGGLETSADNSGNINIQSGGSTVMSVTSSGVAVTGSFSQNGAVYSTQPTFRNLLINGDMNIAQRSTSVTGITSGTTYHTVDRFKFDINTLGTWTMAQDTSVPTGQGFVSSLKMSCTTADASPSANDYASIQCFTEAQNCQHFKFGTSSAETLTLTFWVKSNKTGTYSVMAYQPDATRMLSTSYTISSADTWEKKTVTFTGDTSGTINNDNGAGFNLYWYLGVGSNRQGGSSGSWASYVTANEAPDQTVNLADSTSNYINITGVQLEVGTEATPFEHRPYDMELARCQRYYQLIAKGAFKGITVGLYVTNTAIEFNLPLIVMMRTAPTISQVTGTNYYEIFTAGAADAFNSLTINATQTTERCLVAANETEVSGTGGRAGIIYTNNASSFLAVQAEL